ncbi:hypothetical protein QO004_003031 [Rhizobium mesoamericanum]|uniref:hypothetical protein n=1 Tax=Rhizobium mesoamericanum TaxID=1079800 RepID=UPI0027845599|nr:hypothetical protein [Rhizobium mesoamericanum]MDQ0561238.1 hypothetical protein [Rhizobium mesoamericanum]
MNQLTKTESGVMSETPTPHPLRSYRSNASFSVPDGNGWLLQEVTARLPERVEGSDTAFTSSSELVSALRRAEAAHGEHVRSELAPAIPPRQVVYAEYIVNEQSGNSLPL